MNVTATVQLHKESFCEIVNGVSRNIIPLKDSKILKKYINDKFAVVVDQAAWQKESFVRYDFVVAIREYLFDIIEQVNKKEFSDKTAVLKSITVRGWTINFDYSKVTHGLAFRFPDTLEEPDSRITVSNECIFN